MRRALFPLVLTGDIWIAEFLSFTSGSTAGTGLEETIGSVGSQSTVGSAKLVDIALRHALGMRLILRFGKRLAPFGSAVILPDQSGPALYARYGCSRDRSAMVSSRSSGKGRLTWIILTKGSDL